MDPLTGSLAATALGSNPASYTFTAAGLGNLLGGGQGIGSILGGLGSVFGGKKKKGPDADDLMAMQEKYRIAAFRKNMDLAKEYGIHPLMMLGMQPSGGGGVSVSSEGPQGSNFENLANAGADIARAMGGGSNMQALQERLLSAQIEGQEIDNISRASQIARTNQPANGPTLGDPRYPDQLAMPLGYGDTAPFLRVARDSNGDPLRVYNDDLGDNELLQAFTALRYTAPDYIRNFGTRTNEFFRGALRRDKSRYGSYSKFRK